MHTKFGYYELDGDEGNTLPNFQIVDEVALSHQGTQKPSITRISLKTVQNERLAASDLFSLFTADIIKEDVVFIR